MQIMKRVAWFSLTILSRVEICIRTINCRSETACLNNTCSLIYCLNDFGMTESKSEPFVNVNELKMCFKLITANLCS